MEKIRFYASRWYFSVPMALVLLFVSTSCQTESSFTSNEEKLTGQDIFKGVFFAQGEFANRLSMQSEKHQQYLQLDVEQQEQIQNQVDELVQLIETQNPEFFSEFKRKMLSRNHLLVREGLFAGAEALSSHLYAAFPEIQPVADQIKEDLRNGVIGNGGQIDLEKFNNRKPEYEKLLTNNMITESARTKVCGPWGCALAVYLAVVVHSYAAITVVAAVVIMTANYIAFSDLPLVENRTADPLELEMLINEIASLSV
jgi:hypothetical protein